MPTTVRQHAYLVTDNLIKVGSSLYPVTHRFIVKEEEEEVRKNKFKIEINVDPSPYSDRDILQNENLI